MRHVRFPACVALSPLIAVVVLSATAACLTAMEASHDGSRGELQRAVDRLLGPGCVRVRSDFMGAHAGDPAPWCWRNNGAIAVTVTLLERTASHVRLGWYAETGVRPRLRELDDGVIFESWHAQKLRHVVRIPASVTRFGFYVERTGGGYDGDEADSPRVYFTNRTFSRRAPGGDDSADECHPDSMPMLVYDVSRWLGTDTWLVACDLSEDNRHSEHEDGDSDAFIGVLFTVSAAGTTAVRPMTFARLKALFR